MQWLSKISPATYALRGIRGSILEGQGLLWANVWPLILIGCRLDPARAAGVQAGRGVRQAAREAEAVRLKSALRASGVRLKASPTANLRSLRTFPPRAPLRRARRLHIFTTAPSTGHRRLKASRATEAQATVGREAGRRSYRPGAFSLVLTGRREHDERDRPARPPRVAGVAGVDPGDDRPEPLVLLRGGRAGGDGLGARPDRDRRLGSSSRGSATTPGGVSSPPFDPTTTRSPLSVSR